MKDKKQKSINIKVIKLAKNELPTFKSDNRKKYVEYGKDNKFPNFLLDMSIKSALHSSILDKKTKLVVGSGFVPTEEDEKTQKFLDQINPQESANELLQKIATDLEIHNGFELGISMSRDGKSVAAIYHIPVDRIRSGKMNEVNQVEEYFYSDKWEKYTRAVDYKEYAAFNFQNPVKSNELQIVHAHKYNPISNYYGIPSYIGGINSIDTLSEIDTFHNSQLKNNFNPGIVFTFKGSSTEEEQDAIVKALKKKYEGSQNAGEPIILFPVDENSTPEVKQLEASQLDKLFQQLSETSTNNVVLAHGIPRVLAGVETASGFNTSEILDASMIFNAQYVSKQQTFILNVFNKIMKLNGMKEISIVNENPSILLLDDNIIDKALTQDEIRDALGFEPLNQGEDNNID